MDFYEFIPLFYVAFEKCVMLQIGDVIGNPNLKARSEEMKQHARDVCNFSASLKGNLVSHKRTHTGEKPFKCHVCDFSTAHKKNLKAHIQGMHTKQSL